MRRAAACLFAGLGTCEGAVMDQELLQELSHLGVDISSAGTSLTPGLTNLTSDGCSFVCDALSFSFGSDKVLGNDDGPAYDTGLSEFWTTQQSQIMPTCLFRPAQAEEVAASILLSRLAQCQFAVKSGGHAAFKGASNIENGLTIDLGDLDQVDLHPGGDTVSIGPGSTWYDVYTTLEPLNRAPVGGRVATVGVGGLTLGGGISFLSNTYGWACDNIVNYEVVTASGAILEVNETSYPDLYWALRGGGNNFGVVTRFDAYAYPLGQMWGGNLVHPIAVNASLIHDFVVFGRGSNGTFEDPNAAVILAFAFVATNGTWLAVTSLEYAVAQENGSHPAVFDGFFGLPDLTSDSTANNFMSKLTSDLDLSSPRGHRDTYWVLTFRLDEDLISAALEIWYEEVTALNAVAAPDPTWAPSMDIQVITEPQLERMRRAGGNALGLDAEETGPLVIVHLVFMWDEASNDAAIMDTYQRVLDRAKVAGEALGVGHRFIYMNYASQFQDPISGYGSENKAKLLDVSNKYDPDGVFQVLQPGYFKLDQKPAEATL